MIMSTGFVKLSKSFYFMFSDHLAILKFVSNVEIGLEMSFLVLIKFLTRQSNNLFKWCHVFWSNTSWPTQCWEDTTITVSFQTVCMLTKCLLDKCFSTKRFGAIIEHIASKKSYHYGRYKCKTHIIYKDN
jgi:hypothetical protein